MLLCRGAELRLTIGSENLRSLSLTDRVIAQGRQAMFGKCDPEPLIVVSSFARPAVAARHQNGGIRRRAIGEIERCGDMMLRLAFEDDFFNLKAFAWKLPNHS